MIVWQKQKQHGSSDSGILSKFSTQNIVELNETSSEQVVVVVVVF